MLGVSHSDDSTRGMGPVEMAAKGADMVQADPADVELGVFVALACGAAEL